MVSAKIVWNIDNIRTEVLNYKTYSDYRKNSKSYYFAVKYGLLEEFCEYFNITKTKDKKYWTYDRCKDEALKYDSRFVFNKKSSSAYSSALKNIWLDDICSHMIELIKPKNYWTYDRCKEEALKYNKMTDFQKYSKASYHKCYINNWLDDVSSHMTYIKRYPINYWTYELCKEEALKYNNRTDFSKESNGAYKFSSKNKWLNDICFHMKKQKLTTQSGDSSSINLYSLLNCNLICLY